MVTGFTLPEAVRYDPGQDAYFVSNFGTGEVDAPDNNGFIARISADGAVENLKFIAGGTNGVTLHAPRGMTIVDDTLWVVDSDALRAFDRRSGAPLGSVSFAQFPREFLNDVSPGPDGLYVTDTGAERIYRVAAGAVTIALEKADNPNGITWDAGGKRFIVVPYNGGSAIRSWSPGERSLTEIGKSSGALYDGVEVLGADRILVASQRDSSLHLFTGREGRPIIKTGGEPADIAVDTKRNRVAIPFVGRNLVEIRQLPTP